MTDFSNLPLSPALAPGIDALGYEPEQKALFMDALEKPQGMLLITGPTGSGTTVQDVNQLLKQFTQMQKMMKQMSGKGGMMKMMRAMGGKLPPGLGGGR